MARINQMGLNPYILNGMDIDTGLRRDRVQLLTIDEIRYVLFCGPFTLTVGVGSWFKSTYHINSVRLWSMSSYHKRCIGLRSKSTYHTRGTGLWFKYTYHTSRVGLW